jgi:hypothetical protein
MHRSQAGFELVKHPGPTLMLQDALASFVLPDMQSPLFVLSQIVLNCEVLRAVGTGRL